MSGASVSHTIKQFKFPAEQDIASYEKGESIDLEVTLASTRSADMFRGGCTANYEHIVWSDGNTISRYDHDSLERLMVVEFENSFKLYNIKPSPDSEMLLLTQNMESTEYLLLHSKTLHPLY
jgi:hypothetical protein